MLTPPSVVMLLLRSAHHWLFNCSLLVALVQLYMASIKFPTGKDCCVASVDLEQT